MLWQQMQEIRVLINFIPQERERQPIITRTLPVPADPSIAFNLC